MEFVEKMVEVIGAFLIGVGVFLIGGVLVYFAIIIIGTLIFSIEYAIEEGLRKLKKHCKWLYFLICIMLWSLLVIPFVYILISAGYDVILAFKG